MKVVFLFLCFALNVAFAQVNATKPQSAQAVSKNSAKSSKPTGPTGLGLLKLSMTKEQVEALQASDGIYLTSSLTPYVKDTSPPIEGVEKFEGWLLTPLSTTAYKSILTFTANKLSSIYVNFDKDDYVLEKVIAQIAEKYGAGLVKNDRKDEQCIYKNGANFKITSGMLQNTWVENLSQTEKVETRTLDWLLDSCPSNLRYGSVGSAKVLSLTIQKQSKSTDDKSKNIF